MFRQQHQQRFWQRIVRIFMWISVHVPIEIYCETLGIFLIQYISYLRISNPTIEEKGGKEIWTSIWTTIKKHPGTKSSIDKCNTRKQIPYNSESSSNCKTNYITLAPLKLLIRFYKQSIEHYLNCSFIYNPNNAFCHLYNELQNYYPMHECPSRQGPPD